MLKQPNEIERWQAGAGAEADVDDIGIVARLLRACIDSISHLLHRTDCSQYGLRRCLAILKLWAHGHGAWSGKLDNILERSRNLLHIALSILNPLCKVLYNGIDRFAVAGSNDDLSISLRAYTAEIYSQTKWLVVGLEESVSDSDSDTDSDIPGDEQERSGLEQLVRDVKTHVDCLVDLGNALECPAIDPEHEDEPSVLKVEQRAAHDYHADLILAKFPKAHVELVECLGRTSWDRYQRMQEQRELNANASTSLHIDNEDIAASAQKSRLADSEFKDSGLGTSLPSAPPSRYAETVISFMTSIAGGKRVQIPPMSTEARNGAHFDCNACGKNIRATNNREWRKHLYLDLQPYTCFYTNCAFSSKPFADRQLWSNHLELDHKFGPAWESVTCPLCLESTHAGKAKMLIHFARHMEDIALAALPREVESDEESEGGTDTASENVSEVLLSDDDHLTRSEAEQIEEVFEESNVMRELQARNVTQDDVTSSSATTPLGIFMQAKQEFWSRNLHVSEEQRQALWVKVAPAVPINAFSTNITEMTDTDLMCSRCQFSRVRGNYGLDTGTGLLRIASEDQTHWVLMIWSEYTAGTKLVSTSLNMEVVFHKPQSTLIGWTEQDGTDIVLSFQEPEICALVWKILLQVRGNLERYDEQLKAVAKESMVPDSYWSMSELRSFRKYVGQYGTDWTTIADNMPTKTRTMIRTQYLDDLDRGDIELVKLAQEAEVRKAYPGDLVASDVSHKTLAQPISETEHPGDQIIERPEELYEETAIVEPEAGSVSREAREDDRVANSPREGRLSRAWKHLRAWLEANQDHPYPDADTKRTLAEECGITVAQCSTALSNFRARMAQPNDPTHDGGSQTSPKFATIAQGVVQSHDEHKLSSVIESTSDPSETMASEPIPEDMESSVIKCICGFSDEDGNTVLCEVCDSWQHIICYHGRPEHVPDVHKCIDCNPRLMDRDGAKQVQSRRRELLHVKKNKQHKQNTTRKDKQRNGPLQSTADQVVNDFSTSQKPRIAAVSPEILASTKDLTSTASLPGVQYTRTGRVGKAKKGLKIHNCECGRSYTRAEHLRRHQKNHANDDLQLCHICDKAFYRSDLLERHIERHSEEGSRSQLGLLNLPVPHPAVLMSFTELADVKSSTISAEEAEAARIAAEDAEAARVIAEEEERKRKEKEELSKSTGWTSSICGSSKKKESTKEKRAREKKEKEEQEEKEGNDQSEFARGVREPQNMDGANIPQSPCVEEAKLFRCPVVGCEKAYKNQNGLKYHKQHGHQNQHLKENEDGSFSIVDPLRSDLYLGSGATSPWSSTGTISPQPPSKISTGSTAGQESTSKSAEDDVKTVASGGLSSVDDPRLRPQRQKQLPIDSSVPTTMRSSRTRRHTKLPSHALSHLRNWFNAHRDDPYPSADTKRMLAQECGLNEKQVTTWFTNSRARQLAPQVDYSSHSSDDDDREIGEASQSDLYDAVSSKHKSGVDETERHGNRSTVPELNLGGGVREGSSRGESPMYGQMKRAVDVPRQSAQLPPIGYHPAFSGINTLPQHGSLKGTGLVNALNETHHSEVNYVQEDLRFFGPGSVGDGVWVCMGCACPNLGISPACMDCGSDRP